VDGRKGLHTCERAPVQFCVFSTSLSRTKELSHVPSNLHLAPHGEGWRAPPLWRAPPRSWSLSRRCCRGPRDVSALAHSPAPRRVHLEPSNPGTVPPHEPREPHGELSGEGTTLWAVSGGGASSDYLEGVQRHALGRRRGAREVPRGHHGPRAVRSHAVQAFIARAAPLKHRRRLSVHFARGSSGTPLSTPAVCEACVRYCRSGVPARDDG